MPATVARWGNSLALRLPRAVAEEAHLAEGTAVAITVEDGRLVVSPTRPRYVLSDLLAQMKPEHRHAEVDWGVPVGGEAW